MALHGDDDDVLSLSSPGPGSDYHFEAQVFQPVNSSSHGGGIIYHSQTESRVIRTSSWKRKSISILRCDVHWAVVGLLFNYHLNPVIYQNIAQSKMTP